MRSDVKLTKAQLTWLTTLASEGPTKRAKSNVGYTCMKRGWTRWMLKATDGRLMDFDTARVTFGADFHDKVQWVDAITDLGRSALTQTGGEGKPK